MIEYLIRSGLVLAILLAIYHLWLEKEKMHWFNRFYLLASLVLGLTIPLIKITLPGKDVGNSQLPLSEFVLPNISTMVPTEIDKVSESQNTDLLSLVYGIIAAVLLARFTINLLILMRKVYESPKTNTPDGTIVLIKEKLVPHSFLFYTFLNEDDYLNQRIEQEIITHEFTHVRQMHSADLLFMELLIAIFWFNPVFIFYKKAIQLNHEFLADEAVIESSCNISTYQQLLLQKATLKSVRMASNFNFSVTKKRFKMMKKQTSKNWKIVKAVSLLPVAAVLMLAFSDTVFAQGTSTETKMDLNLPNLSQVSKDKYYNGGLVRFKDVTGNTVTKKYETLNVQEKKYLPVPVKPTIGLMQTWEKPGYIISVNSRLKQASEKLKVEDFIAYYSIKSENDNLNYIDLLTPGWIETFKSKGGIFNLNGQGLSLMLPPPVVVPPKN